MTDNIDIVGQEAQRHFGFKHAARERALPKSRAAIRHYANSIRAIHGQAYDSAAVLLEQASVLLTAMMVDLRDNQDICCAGLEQVAQKEHPEAACLMAL